MSTAAPVRRVVIEAPNVLRLEDVHLDEAPPIGHARVRPTLIGICGSDLHVLEEPLER